MGHTLPAGIEASTETPYSMAGGIISSTAISTVAPGITGELIYRRRCALRRFAPGISSDGSGCTLFVSLLGGPVTSMPTSGTISVGWSVISSTRRRGGEIGSGWPRIL